MAINYDAPVSAETVINDLARRVDEDVVAALEDILGTSSQITVKEVSSTTNLGAITAGTTALQVAPAAAGVVQTFKFADLSKDAQETVKLIVFDDSAVAATLTKRFEGVLVLGDAPEGQVNKVVINSVKGAEVTVQTGEGSDSVKTGSSTDSVVTGQGNDSVSTGGGADTIAVSRAATPTDRSKIVVNGGAGRDSLDLADVSIASVTKSGGSVVITLADGRQITAKGIESFVYDDDGSAATVPVVVGVKDLLDDLGG